MKKKKQTNELKQSLNEEGSQTCEPSQYNLRRTVNFQKNALEMNQSTVVCYLQILFKIQKLGKEIINYFLN